MVVACHGLWRVCLMPSQPACGWPPVYRTSCRRCADAGCRAYRRHDSNVIALRLDRQHHSVGVHTESPIHTLMQASHDDDAVPAKRQGRWGMIKASFRRTGRASSRKNTHNEPAASGKLSDPALAYPASQAAGCGHGNPQKDVHWFLQWIPTTWMPCGASPSRQRPCIMPPARQPARGAASRPLPRHVMVGP